MKNGDATNLILEPVSINIVLDNIKNNVIPGGVLTISMLKIFFIYSFLVVLTGT